MDGVGKRMLVLAAMAVPIGAISAVVANALLWLIAIITNLAFFHQWTSSAATPQHAIEKMIRHDVGRLPVLDRTGSGRPVGYLGRASILAARVKRREEEEFRQRGPILEQLSPALPSLRK